MSRFWSRQAGHGSRLLRCARVVSAAAVLALGLSIAPLLFHDNGWSVRSALACGLGNTPTMLANGDPALLYPVPPTVNVPADQPIGIFALKYAVGSSITFGEDFSHMSGAPAPSSLQWRWTFGDGSAASQQLSPRHTFAQAGSYAVRAQIYDSTSNAWTDFDSAQIQVIPSALANPPVARATASTTAVPQNGTITFDATGSHAVVGAHLTYEWNFNDASTATGSHVSHQFTVAGKGFVALLVTDDRGARSVATINIAVVTDQSLLPSANLTASVNSGAVGQAIAFDASGSGPDGQGDAIAQYVWDFGDGAQTTTQSATTSHTYTHSGSYRVTVQAVDVKGTPAQAVLTVSINATGSATGPGNGKVSNSTRSWVPYLIGGVLVLALSAGIFWVVRGQIKQARLERERAAMMQLRRAKRIPRAGVRPGDPRWGDPRAGGRTGSTSRTPAERPGRRDEQ